MKPEEIIKTIQSTDGVYSKAELILLIENMSAEEFEQFCESIRGKGLSLQHGSVH